MNKNGFIATSLLYTFFLAFIGLFVGMIAIYLQNRVYLNKLEDSSKNSIYIRKINYYSELDVNINGDDDEFKKIEDGKYQSETTSQTYILGRCELIYFGNNKYYLEGCPTS